MRHVLRILYSLASCCYLVLFCCKKKTKHYKQFEVAMVTCQLLVKITFQHFILTLLSVDT